MALSTYTIVQWTLIIMAIAGYVYYTKFMTAPPNLRRVVGVENAQKLESLLDVDSSGTDSKKKKNKAKPTVAGKKKKPVAKAEAAPQIVEATPEPMFEEEAEHDDDDSLQRLAGLSAKKLNKKPVAEVKKATASRVKGNVAPASLKAPVSPTLEAVSSAASTAGADADDEQHTEAEDEPVSRSGVADMLEDVNQPGVLRITPSSNPFTTVGKKKNVNPPKKEPLTQKQRQTQKKKELAKEAKEEDNRLRLAALNAHLKSGRLATEAEAARKGKTGTSTASAPAAPASVWTGSNNAVTGGTLLDTFEPKSGSGALTPPSSSDVDTHSQFSDDVQLTKDQIKDIPPDVLADYYRDRREAEQAVDQGWTEVKKVKKTKPIDSGNDGETQKPNVAVPESSKSAKAAPTKQSSANLADIKVPVMPNMPESEWAVNGW